MMNFNFELKNKIITDEKLRWVEIYKIVNTINQKVYIGQAISHIRKNDNFIHIRKKHLVIIQLNIVVAI